MSDHKQSAAARRDDRNAKTPTKSRATVGKVKNTKRWCKGKVGVEHQPKCQDYCATKGAPPYLAGWKLLVCQTCGKELETYFPSKFAKRAKPAWVTK